MNIFRKKSKSATPKVAESQSDTAVMEKPTPEEIAVAEKPKKKATKVKAKSNSRYNDSDIGMLHNKFFSDSDHLLIDSEVFLGKREEQLKYWEEKELENEGKVDELKEFGFGNTGQAKQFDKDKEEKYKEISCARRDIEKKTQVAEAVIYFATKYPAYKFITYNGIKQICEKYNLVFGQNKLFTGFVPQRNLDEIKAFWQWKTETDGVKLEDRAYNLEAGSNIYDKTYRTFNWTFNSMYNDVRSGLREDYPQYIYEGDEDSEYKNKWQESLEEYFSEDEINNHKRYRNVIRYDDFIQRMLKKDYPKDKYLCRFESEFQCRSMDELYIAAPVEDMDLKNHKISDYEVIPKEVEKEKRWIDDPVVFYPVSHGDIVGGLICTAWGDEASDSLVMNENHN